MDYSNQPGHGLMGPDISDSSKTERISIKLNLKQLARRQ